MAKAMSVNEAFDRLYPEHLDLTVRQYKEDLELFKIARRCVFTRIGGLVRDEYLTPDQGVILKYRAALATTKTNLSFDSNKVRSGVISFESLLLMYPPDLPGLWGDNLKIKSTEMDPVVKLARARIRARINKLYTRGKCDIVEKKKYQQACNIAKTLESLRAHPLYHQDDELPVKSAGGASSVETSVEEERGDWVLSSSK